LPEELLLLRLLPTPLQNGPLRDTEPLLNWRASKTDEEIVELGGVTDAEYKIFAKREFGLDVKL
jgi:hypothetical protein